MDLGCPDAPSPLTDASLYQETTGSLASKLQTIGSTPVQQIGAFHLGDQRKAGLDASGVLVAARKPVPLFPGGQTHVVPVRNPRAASARAPPTPYRRHARVPWLCLESGPRKMSRPQRWWYYALRHCPFPHSMTCNVLSTIIASRRSE